MKAFKVVTTDLKSCMLANSFAGIQYSIGEPIGPVCKEAGKLGCYPTAFTSFETACIFKKMLVDRPKYKYSPTKLSIYECEGEEVSLMDNPAFISGSWERPIIIPSAEQEWPPNTVMLKTITLIKETTE